MNKYEIIDLESWSRKQLFEFYNTFANPCFNVTVKLDAKNIYKFAKDHKESFFLTCLYAILKAANKTPQVRQRIIDGRPVEFERIDTMTPVMGAREEFTEVWCEYADSFCEFKEKSAQKLAEAKSAITATIPVGREDFICASCAPWIHFESISQAEYKFGQTIPILAWGKMEDGKIPIGVKFNHCFLDGFTVSKFFEAIQQGFTAPESL